MESPKVGVMLAPPLQPGSSARGYGFELIERLSDVLRQISPARVIDPAFESDSEDGDPCLRSQARGRLSDAALVQRAGERRREFCEFDQLALPQLCVRGNDGLALYGALAALLEAGAGSLQGGYYPRSCGPLRPGPSPLPPSRLPP